MRDRVINYRLSESGEPVPEPDFLRWGVWYSDPDTELHLADELVVDADGQPVRVSTAFLAIDHQHREDGPPILWETMVFGGRHDGSVERYPSRAEALTGHARMVRFARS